MTSLSSALGVTVKISVVASQWRQCLAIVPPPDSRCGVPTSRGKPLSLQVTSQASTFVVGTQQGMADLHQIVKLKSGCFDEGGNSGLGVETARALASAGARVILTSRKVSAGEDVVAKLQEDGLKVSYLFYKQKNAYE